MKMLNPRLLLWSGTAALSGFLFGFDTIVISGAEQQIQQLWNLSAGIHGLTISSALWGTVIGALFGGWPAEKAGRKKVLIAVGILYFVSAVGSALAPEIFSFIFFRFIGGVGVGMSTIASPMFISEIAPAKYRGGLTNLFQLNVVSGILIALISNTLLADIGENAWRWMLAIQAFPAILYTLCSLALPESPRWLIAHGERREEGLAVFRLSEPELPEAELQKRADEILKEVHCTTHPEKFFTRRLRRPIMIAFFVSFFNQLSGINAIFYYAPRVFELAGMDRSSAFMQSIGLGVINVIFTIAGLWLIDRAGRKTLLYIGCTGYILSLATCSWGFFTQNYHVVGIATLAFIASHAIGSGSVAWPLMSEVFPNRNRSAGQTVGCFSIWFWAAMVTLFFPMAAERFDTGYIFGFFCFMMVLQMVWIYLQVPETKGISLEELHKMIEGKERNQK